MQFYISFGRELELIIVITSGEELIANLQNRIELLGILHLAGLTTFIRALESVQNTRRDLFQIFSLIHVGSLTKISHLSFFVKMNILGIMHTLIIILWGSLKNLVNRCLVPIIWVFERHTSIIELLADFSQVLGIPRVNMASLDPLNPSILLLCQ